MSFTAAAAAAGASLCPDSDDGVTIVWGGGVTTVFSAC